MAQSPAAGCAVKRTGAAEGNANDLGEWDAKRFPGAGPLSAGLPADVPHPLGSWLGFLAGRKSGSFMREESPQVPVVLLGP